MQQGNQDALRAPLTRYDFGWMLLCIGMAIGAGTVFMPVQIGLKGVWVFVFAFIIAYPATYLLQDLYLKTLQESQECEDYANIISQYLGKNWGAALGVIYFIMLMHGIFIYSISVVNDSASYLQTFGVAEALLSNNVLYCFLVLGALVLIASRGERLLFKISGPMVAVKVGIIILLGVVMIPHWRFENIAAFPEASVFFRDVLLTIPFVFFSAVFVQVLSPMNIAYHKQESDHRLAAYQAIRVHRLSYMVLVTIILFFALACTFSISQEQAIEAFEHNISALAIAAKVIPGYLVGVMTVLLNIFAVVTAFLGIYLGFQEAIKGVVMNIIARYLPKERIHDRLLQLSIGFFVVLLLTGWVFLDVSVVNFFHIASPLYAVVTCLIPCYLVYRVAALKKYQDWRFWSVLAFGALLFISPFFKIFE